MDSEVKQSEESISLNNSKDERHVDIKVLSKSDEAEFCSASHGEKELESESNQITGKSPNPEVNCEIVSDEQNTQIIIGDECVNEIDRNSFENTQCESEIVDLNLEKEVPMEAQNFEVEETKDNEHQSAPSVEEKLIGKMDEYSEKLKMDSSENLDDTVLVVSDEEVKEGIGGSARKILIDTEVEEINTHEMEEGTAKNYGEESQATTVDIIDIDKAPSSPEDLFASQSLGEVKQNSENNLIDYEDFIPSSLPTRSEKNENKEEQKSLAVSASISTPQKRKMEEMDKGFIDAKVPRLDIPVVTISKEVPGDVGSMEEQKEVEVIDNSVSEEDITEADKSIARLTSKEDLTDEDIERGDESVDKKEGEMEPSLESSNHTVISKDSRKSVEIIFSSFENSDKKDPMVKQGCDLSVVLEENGEYDDDSEVEHLHLRMSLSPSQITQSFSETDISKDSEVQSQLDTIGKTSNGDTTSSNNLNNSHHVSKSTTEFNSHSCEEAPRKVPDTVTVDDICEVQISPPDGKTSTSNDIVVLQTMENKTVAKSDNDSEVTVLLDKNEDSSRNAKHKDMNGTLLKRKHSEFDEDIENIILDNTEQIDTVADADMRKRSRFANLLLEDRSSPDLPLLLPKGKLQSTPNDNSRTTPMNASVSTVDPSSVSAGKQQDHEDSSLPLRVVKRTYALHVRLHVHDDLRQVHSIEMMQCQNMEDFMLMGAMNHRESSGGSVADESKNSSPSSVMSLGPFSLKTQSWRLSSSSTSTTSSGHSNIGMKSKSDDWHFTAPLNPAPSRNNKLRNVHFSPEFERDLFELAERTVYVDDTESKLSCLVAKGAAHPVSSCAPLTEVLDGVKDIPQPKPENEDHVVETPKSTKKLSRGNRNTRSSGRTLVSKIIKEVAEEETSPQPTLEKETPSVGESSGSQRKARKTPSRSSKRTVGNTPNTPVAPEESKVSTPTISQTPTGGRSRRNRNDQTQVEKTDSSSQESSHVYDWDAEGCFTKLVPEAPVFARWTDKKYYPGRIREKIKDGRWVIEFDDKTVRPLKEEFIIPINILTKGQIVFAYDGDEYEQGIIVEFKLEDGEVHYGVDLDSGRKLFVPRARLFMSEDQARLLQEGMDPKSPTTSSPALTTVSCDNIVHHKRPRSTRVLFGNASPSVSGVLKTAKRPSHDTSCSSSVSDSNDKGPTLVLEEVGGVDPEVPSSFPESLHTPSGRGKGPGRIKSKSRTPRRNTPANHTIADTQELNKLHEILGPIPMKGSKMFSGKCFLLTHSGVRAIDSSKINISSKSSKKSEQTSSSEYEEVSTDEGVDSKIPYVKEHLKQQLEAGGGTVYENFEDVPEDQYQNCLLIADRSSLTAKYILCLANGIKIIQHPWVIEEAKGSSHPLVSARLQAGWDLEGQQYVPTEATVRTRKQKPLNKKEVGIVNESQTFVKFWERVLELLGANVRHISPGSPDQDRQFSGVDVILTDSTCPPEVQDRAREWSIPLVSTVWVTQTLINWRIRPYTGHPHYRYDYCASD